MEHVIDVLLNKGPQKLNVVLWIIIPVITDC